MPSDRITERFTARTRHHGDFALAALAAVKRERGLTASVVIPARNEALTVGEVAGTLRRTLVEDGALLDEVLVVDADSTDGTGELARASGAQVVRQSDVLPSAGTALGKGEALWKGLAASSGDLVVYIDADIVDIGPRFVVGLLGPLLTEPGVRFTKATYDRPLQIGGHVHSSGGGRVTELLAMLVDVVEAYGPDAIIQVDLGRRVHTHRSLDALGRMAAEMLHVAIDRLSRQGRLLLTDPLATALLQPTRDAVGSLAMTSSEVTHGERPPLRDWRERA